MFCLAIVQAAFAMHVIAFAAILTAGVMFGIGICGKCGEDTGFIIGCVIAAATASEYVFHFEVPIKYSDIVFKISAQTHRMLSIKSEQTFVRDQ